MVEIRKLIANESPPMDLLLLADPSSIHIEESLKRGECFIASQNGAVLGVYILLETRPFTVEIVNVAVVENEQGRGLGKRLALDAIERAKISGYRSIEIGTGNSSIGQLALYQKCGFRIIDVDRDYFIKNYKQAIYENGIQCRDMVRLAMELVY